VTTAGKRRNLVLVFALVVGAVAFINGMSAVALLFTVSSFPQRRLFELNAYIGTAVVTLSLGGVLVYQASSALGNTGSTVMRYTRGRLRWLIPIVVAFPLLVALGQVQVDHPATLPWLFPVTNLLIVSIPSAVIAIAVAQRYQKFNRFAWPLSWREWTSCFIYGAIGATSVASVINTAYLVLVGALLIHAKGSGDAFQITDNLPTLPRPWGIAFDLSVLSVVAPLNEEFWKGMIVALLFFRRGGAARCFLWGVLAGAGFNLLETFQNSLSVVSPDLVSAREIGNQWWLFASARAGTAGIHACATGFSALGMYGLLRRKPRFMLGYPAGVAIHGTWNFLNYTLAGDALLSMAGPDSRLLDILSVAGLILLFLVCATLLWEMPRRLRDGVPAPLYRALGMLPGADGLPSPPSPPPGLASFAVSTDP